MQIYIFVHLSEVFQLYIKHNSTQFSNGKAIKLYFPQSIVQMYKNLNIVSDHPHIPEEAFLFLPYRSNDPKIKDDYRIGEGKNIRRLLFQGWAENTITPYEVEKLKQFDDYVARKGIKLDERWDKSWRLRFLLSTGCNIKKCLGDMEIFIAYQNRVRELAFTEVVSKYLKQGVFYLAGRDSHYRPIMVFDVEKIIKLDMKEEDLLETQTYFFQYVLRNYLIPGQVENWVAIIDAAQTGLFSLVGSMKKSFTFLSDTYRSRMIPTSISFLWGIIKNFLEEETVRKINFFDEQTIQPLLEFCNPSQLQKKFGGTLENIPQGHFWPPREVSKDYKLTNPKEPIRYLTRQQYTEHYNKKILYDTKFHVQNLIKPANKQLRVNNNLITIKRMEKEFKIQMEMCQEDVISQDKYVPLSRLSSPLNFLQMQAKNKETKKQNVPTNS